MRSVSISMYAYRALYSRVFFPPANAFLAKVCFPFKFKSARPPISCIFQKNRTIILTFWA